MNQQASIAALMSAYARAFHAEHDPAPVFNDHLARQLMTDQEYADMSSYILSGVDFLAPEKKGCFANDCELLAHLVNAQFAPTPLARASFCEESLRTAFRTGTEQYVILGAGLDTFAFREKELVQAHQVFEVDHPLTQFAKRKRVERAGWPWLLPGENPCTPALAVKPSSACWSGMASRCTSGCTQRIFRRSTSLTGI